jgi:hypothetical protein
MGTPRPESEARPDRTAVLVIRAWTEPGLGGLRARITRSVDISRSDEMVSSAGSIDEVCGQVRGWLEAFLRQSSSTEAPQ